MNINLLATGRCLSVLLAALLLASCAPLPENSPPATAATQQLQQLQQQQQQQADLLTQLQQQIKTLQTQLSQPSAGATAKAELAAAAPARIAVPQQNQNYQIPPAAGVYQEAFADLAAGRWAEAEAGFESFLSNHGDHQYAANARYWLANAQTLQGNSSAALKNLNQVISDPQAGSRIPAALLQVARIYRQHGLDSQAKAVFEQLRSRFPESPEAQTQP